MASIRPRPSIVKTSPPPEARSNPRRPPAHRSVSLLHSQPPRARQQSSSSSDSEKRYDGQLRRGSAHTDSPSSLQALAGRYSSGESSSAEKWFEKSNNEVRDNNPSFTDNDPPFFMRNSSSSETPPDVRLSHLKDFSNNHDFANSLQFRTELLQLGTDGGSTEDFRSVIDDLTIENKKLKRRLNKYEKLHDSHLKDEKLFEVKIHGLPAEKKRELEETLRKFAANLDSKGTTAANAFPVDGYASLPPMLKTFKTASSQTSAQNADSAYASMSASGQGSSGYDSKKITPTNYLAARQQNIRSYLHDIPEGLFPQQNATAMTERAKKKLVVRRMEQLFDGRDAATSAHQHSNQQQEVSQNAARIDRSAFEASGRDARVEGSREANIMDQDIEDPLNPRQNNKMQSLEDQFSEERLDKNPLANQGGNSTSPAHPNVEQRPTRPLDLDPQRAQIPADNIRYMRQMGFSPTDSASSVATENCHGWIYLNFLINMAQLHTINVTSDFVRKALSEYSIKFEISSDGRKARWKGVSSITRSSSSGEGSSHDRTRGDTSDGGSPRKRPKLYHRHSGQSNVTMDSKLVGGEIHRLRAENSKHTYTPMFFHKNSSDEAGDSSSEGDDHSVYSSRPAPFPGESLGVTNTGVHTNSGNPITPRKKRQKREDGPIIFYNNAHFCTDLTGDQNSNVNHHTPLYMSATNVPVGDSRNTANRTIEKRGPLAEAPGLSEPAKLDETPIPEPIELSLPPLSPSCAASSPKELKPIDLEVTGIGGVWPTDNFAISVESRQARIDQQPVSNVPAQAAPKALPPQFAQILREPTPKSKTEAVLHKEVIASTIQNLPPSELPPAISFMSFGDDSLDDDYSEIDDDDDDGSDTSGSHNALPPAAAPQPVEIPYALSEDEDDGESEDESDGEVDFLAAARELDPEAVREKEREYDANMAERLAEEIPAGSSAATAGGGSGFASPASRVAKSERLRVIRDARATSTAVDCATASDSMVVEGMQDSSSSGDSNSSSGSDSDDEMSVQS